MDPRAEIIAKRLSPAQAEKIAEDYAQKHDFNKISDRYVHVKKDFTLIFFVVNNRWNAREAYIKAGVYINDISPDECWTENGHITLDIRFADEKETVSQLDTFFENWTDKRYMHDAAKFQLRWIVTTPKSDFYSGKVDLVFNPIPARELASSPLYVINYLHDKY